jgi:hypothetical protein
MTMLIINTVEVGYASDVDYEVNEGATTIRVRSKAALPQYEQDEKKRYAVSGLFCSYYYQLNDLLEEYYDPGAETELMMLNERALITGTTMQLFKTAKGPDKYLWANIEQFSACPDNVRMYTLRTAPDMTRAIAVYDDMFLGGLVRLLGTGQQMAIQETLKKLSEKEIM